MAYIKGPDNIKGFSANVGYDFGLIDLSGTYKDYKDKDEDWLGKAVGDIFDNNKIKYWNAGLNAKTGNMGKFSLTYENLNNHGAKSNYWTLAWNKTFGNNLIKLGVQRINNNYNDTKGNMIFGQTTFNF